MNTDRKRQVLNFCGELTKVEGWYRIRASAPRAPGSPTGTASLRVPVEDSEAMLVSAIAFNADAVQGLLALTKGDACAIPAGRSSRAGRMTGLRGGVGGAG